MRALLTVVFVVASLVAVSQSTGTVKGVVRDETGATVPGAGVIAIGFDANAVTDAEGKFSLALPAGRAIKLRWSFTGMDPYEEEVILNDGEV
ncbi:MAG TPA: carboxypeptidase regulatory-like domain-containing protein, partial [Flavobacteriales bacterium]|nr:carboxypeptidase regulatory-like domain-containing protein [Flavobacteriales bacterium]